MTRYKRLYSILIFSTLFLIGFITCAGPAAHKAKKQYGVTPKEIEKCGDRKCFYEILVKYESEILKKGTADDGTYYEVYKVRRERGSNLRAFVHGVLSIGTLGIWNVVGYPIEGFVSDDKYIVFKSTYDQYDTATKVEIQGG